MNTSKLDSEYVAEETDPLLRISSNNISSSSSSNNNNNNNNDAAAPANTPTDYDTLADAKVRTDYEKEEQNTNNEDVTNTILETVTEALEHAVENIGNAVEDAVETFQETVEEVQEELHEVVDIAGNQLHEADEGELTFLDMTLTRGLSLLPGELQRVTDQWTTHTETTELPKTSSSTVTETTKPPLSAYLGLASAVTALSAIGPLLAMQQDVSSLMKIFWRMFGTSILLLPLSVMDIRREGFPQLTGAQWVTFGLSTVSYLIMVGTFVLAIDLTSIGSAVILSNSQAIMLLVGNLFVGNPVNMLEGGGALTAFVGAVLCAKDSATSRDESDGHGGWASIHGDALALLAGMGGVGYLIFASSVRTHMPLFVFTFATMFFGSLLCISFQIFALQETITFNRNTTTGVFGFLSWAPDRLPLEICIVVICNCGGTLGYIRAMQFFDPLIISVAGLMEPVTAEFLSFWFGVSMLPGYMGWLGNILVACGTLAVVWPTDNKKHVDVGQ